MLEGQSVTVPCHYNPQYISNVKYWCHGRMIDFCSSLARTDDPKSTPQSKGRVTIADDPTQHVFTVSMQNLTVEDSGWYWCGVELGGMWVADSTASLYISVIQGELRKVRNSFIVNTTHLQIRKYKSCTLLGVILIGLYKTACKIADNYLNAMAI